MADIRFTFKLELEIIAKNNGSGILVLYDGDELELSQLPLPIRRSLREWTKQWADHYKAMESFEPSSHPADSEFGAPYVRGLNEDMGKT